MFGLRFDHSGHPLSDWQHCPLSPLRGSTEEEYLSHISADIYGDAGVQKAAEYPFVAVDESYFDDALK